MIELCNADWYESRYRERIESTPAKYFGQRIRHENSNYVPEGPCNLLASTSYTGGTLYSKVQSYSSKITDVVLKDSVKDEFKAQGKKFPKVCFKPVYHELAETKYLDTPQLEDQYPPVQWIQTKGSLYRCWRATVRSRILSTTAAGAPEFYAPVNQVKSYESSWIKHTVTWPDLARTFIKIQPSFDRELDSVSIPNFLLELRDLRQLGNLFSTKYRNIAEATGDKFLGVNFGALPLIRDIETMKKLRGSIDTFIKKWNEFAESGKVLSFHEQIFKFDQESSHDYDNLVNDFDNMYFSVKGVYKSKAYMHLYVKPKPIDPNISSDVWNHLSGFDNLAGVTWDAIPFSFVVDWFTNIGDLFDVDEKSWLAYDIVDCGYSYYYEISATSTGYGEIGTEFSAPNDRFGPYNFIPFYQIEKEYTRERIDPSLFEGLRIYAKDYQLESKDLTPYQSALAASLLAVYTA